MLGKRDLVNRNNSTNQQSHMKDALMEDQISHRRVAFPTTNRFG